MRNLIVSAALVTALGLAAAPTPAAAVTRSVEKRELSHFVGTDVIGRANVDLGVVDTVDPRLGLIAMRGKHGEFAVLHTSLLKRDGFRMFAPELSVGDIAQISMDRAEWPHAVAVAKASIPTIIREEPANTVRLLPQRRAHLLAGGLDSSWAMAALAG